MNKKRFVIILAALGIALALGTGVILTFIERLVVTFTGPSAPAPARPAQENIQAEPISCGNSSSTFSPARRTADGTWTAVNDIDVWVSDTFQSGDRADVLYYFSDSLLLTPDREHPGEPTTWTFMRYDAPDIIGKKIKDGAMGPLVLVLPRSDKKFIEIESAATTLLSERGITIASRNLMGHGAGVQKIIGVLRSSPPVKSIHLIDPYAVYLTDELVDRYRDRIVMYYNPGAWTGQFTDNTTALQRIALQLEDRAQLVTTNHSDILLKYLDHIEDCFK